MSCSDLILNIEGYVSAQLRDEGVGSSLALKDAGNFRNNRISLARGLSWTNLLSVEGFLNEAQCFLS